MNIRLQWGTLLWASQRPKVLGTARSFTLLTLKTRFGPQWCPLFARSLAVFCTFHLDMCFAPQWGDFFRHLNYVLRATTECNFSVLSGPHRSGGHKSLTKRGASWLPLLWSSLFLLFSDLFFWLSQFFSFSPILCLCLTFFSDSSHLCSSSVNIVGRLTSKVLQQVY